ncbi:MAG: NAD(P)-dependent oxidoreductase [Myxococcales bacterium]|jgi:uroporphyrin-III C-methyltransferase/precorrin-2 dehydrogenase/sirohydrochlorin ferrochelatase
MDYLPIHLRVAGERCLVVGAGSVAWRKIELLRSAGAEVHVVAPEAGEGVRRLARDGLVSLRSGRYARSDLQGAVLVIAATADDAVNAQVARDARAAGLPVNVVDKPVLCSFIVPAIVDRAPVLVAVSTGGASPVLARLTRARLEAALHPRHGRLAALASRYRDAVKARFEDGGARRRFWERTLEGEVAELVLAGDEEAAAQRLEQALAAPEPSNSGRSVCVVLAGDGDPGRLSLRALRMLGRADRVCVQDAPVQAVAALARRDAERLSLPADRDACLQQVAALETREGERLCLVLAGDDLSDADAGALSTLRATARALEILRPAPRDE